VFVLGVLVWWHMESELRAVVSGRVQLVMYRDFTCRAAKRFGLVGTVRNLRDGTVEVVAQGDAKKLEHFVSTLKRGSPLSRVDGVEVEWRTPSRDFKIFSIVF